jgi:hypothetical protein
MDAMTVRRGLLYTGVFLVAAGGVTLAVATGLIDRDAVADAVVALWPLAVIAVGAGLVLRRSRAALAAGVVAALVPGLALGATVVAAPSVAVPCTGAGAATGAAIVREGSFTGPAAVTLDLSCGEAAVTTVPGTAWRVEARDGRNRTSDVQASAARLSVDAGAATSRWNARAAGVDWDVAVPSGTTIDLTASVSAGSGTYDLRDARLGTFGLAVSAGDARADLTGAALQRLDVDVSAGSASVVLPAATFSGDVNASAGSVELCAPDGLGLRVHADASLGSIDTDGLVRRGSAWETPGYATAPFKADLAVEASVGSVTVNPQGGCK